MSSLNSLRRSSCAPRPRKGMERLLRRIPKVDIHCHLDGSLRPATALDLARSIKIKLPADTEQELESFVRVSPTCRSLAEFLQVFEILYPLLRNPEAIERIAYELCEDCAQDNILYVEARLAPMLNAHRKFPIEEVLSSVFKGLGRGRKHFGVLSDVTICLFRSHSLQQNRKAFETAARLWGSRPRHGPRVVGMDVAGDEANHPTLEFAEFFERARSLGMPTTCHAGETQGTENLRAALELKVHRIGHGTHLLEDPILLERVVRRRIPLEIGITSNVLTRSVSGLKSHPARLFWKAGVPISLNTDDRGVLGIDLTHEYLAAASLGFSVGELARISRDSIAHLFIPEHEKRGLRSRIQTEVGLLEQKSPLP